MFAVYTIHKPWAIFGYVGQLETSRCVAHQKDENGVDRRQPVNSLDSDQAGFLDIKFPAELLRPASKTVEQR